MDKLTDGEYQLSAPLSSYSLHHFLRSSSPPPNPIPLCNLWIWRLHSPLSLSRSLSLSLSLLFLLCSSIFSIHLTGDPHNTTPSTLLLPIMPFLACILVVVCGIWQTVTSAAESCLETAVQDCFTSLRNWVVPQVTTLLSSCFGDFEAVPVSTTAIVGAEETLDEIRAHLNDDSVGIIGIYGMGGIGKTTILQKINNDLFESGISRAKFGIGIWVTVSKVVSIPKIQKQIADRLRLTLSDDESQDARTLFQALYKRRFLVLLDILWEKLDLVRVGIPVPTTNQPNCKIAFTTRTLDVCIDMEANRRVRVKPLDDGRSWELFCSKVGTEVDLDNSLIQRLAKQVVDKCGGLPLALITVGKAMANKRQPGQWELAVKDLDHYAEKLRGMENVLSCLKLSYDYLKDDNMKSALLYCAMYPEDRAIDRDELIEHWIGEGMLDDDGVYEGIDVARSRGCNLIAGLQDCCLLEAGIDDADRWVRLHDAVRDLALWLNRTDDKVDGFMAGEDLINVANTQGRGHIRRIWMHQFDLEASHSSISNWPPDSWTLLLNHARVGPCPLQGIFNRMRNLCVLNLQGANQLEELPIEIDLLKDLKYLNLRGTLIGSLPKELGNLVRLRQLNLRRTGGLLWIPREAIVRLSSLQVLDMCESRYDWRAAERSGGRQVELSDLDGLKRLQELGISVDSPQDLATLSRSKSLQSCTRYLSVLKSWEDQGEDDPLWMAFTKNGSSLRELYLVGDLDYPWVGDLRINLNQFPCLEHLYLILLNCEMTVRTTTIVQAGTNAARFKELEVHNSNGWKELKLLGKFPSLEVIWLNGCDGMEELLLDDENEGAGSQQETRQEQLKDSRFRRLKGIDLQKITDLKSIGRRPLALPSLKYIRVESCPQLRRLPLGPGSAPRLKEIRGEQEWWDALEWGTRGDEPNIRDIFAPFFCPRSANVINLL